MSRDVVIYRGCKIDLGLECEMSPADFKAAIWFPDGLRHTLEPYYRRDLALDAAKEHIDWCMGPEVGA